MFFFEKLQILFELSDESEEEGKLDQQLLFKVNSLFDQIPSTFLLHRLWWVNARVDSV